VSLPPDFDRIARLNKRLDEICREAEEIREKIQSARHDGALWPDRRRESRMFVEEESSSLPRKPEPT
jgi:uncharacterized protein Yka (UPF0111/DUF47 family)